MDTEKIALNATINALKSQRDAYANESVTLAVRVVLLTEELKEKQNEIEALNKKLVKRQKKQAQA